MNELKQEYQNQISVNTEMAEDISELRGEVAIIHQRLCERELVT